MVNKIQILRSTIFGNRPAVGAQPAGSPYVNFASNQFGVIDTSQVPRDLIGVPFFSTGANYNAGQPVNYQGSLYTANTAIVAGAWNPVNWTLIGGSFTDALAFNGLQINGNFEVSQENGASQVAVTNTSKFTVDMWRLATSAAIPMFCSQLAMSTIFGYSKMILMSVGSAVAFGAADYMQFYQPIEGYRWARLLYGGISAKPITIGFWVLSNTITGTATVSIRNSNVDRCYCAPFTINAANTWEYKVVTIPGCTDGTWGIVNDVGGHVTFCFGCGTNLQAAPNTWVSGSNKVGVTGATNFFNATNAGIFLVGVVVLPGVVGLNATISSLISRPYQSELVLCQRYWESTYNTGTKPGTTNNLEGMDNLAITTNTVIFPSGGNMVKGFQYRCTKRAAPTVTPWEPTLGRAGIAADFASGGGTTCTVFNASENGCRWQASPTGATSVLSIGVHFTVDARF